MYLPGATKATIAVRCCPVLFELRKPEEELKEPKDDSVHDGELVAFLKIRAWILLDRRAEAGGFSVGQVNLWPDKSSNIVQQIVQ